MPRQSSSPTGHGEPAPGEPGRPASGGWPRRFLAVAALAVAAAAAGAGIALVASSGPSASPSPAAAPSSRAPFTAPGQAGGSGRIPGGGLPSGAVAQLIMGGRVLAVSHTSITVDGGGHSEVAAVTSATRFTGRAKGIGSVKVGDMIVAEMRMSGGKVTAVTIQDPAGALPVGGSAPGVS
jgi:hypothetical protein